MTFEHCNRTMKRWPAVGILFLSLLRMETARADEATKQRFLREYPPASQELMRRFEHVQCTIEQVIPGGKGKIVSHFRKSGTFEKVEIETAQFQIDQRTDSSLVILKSPDEGRTLHRANGAQFVDSFDRFVRQRPRAIYDEFRKSKSIGSAWKSYETRWSNSIWTEQVNRSFRSRCGQFVYAIWGGEAGILALWMLDPGFELIEASKLPDRPEIIEVRFRRDRTKQVRELVVRLNSNNHWAVVSLRSPIQNSARDFGFEVHYGEPIDGIAWPKRIAYLNGISVDLKGWSFLPTPLPEFRPSHYGLPDRRWDWFDTRILLMTAAFVLLTMLASSFVLIQALRDRIRKRLKVRPYEPRLTGGAP